MTTISIRVTDETVRIGLRKVGQGLPDATREELDEFMQEVKKEASGGYAGGNSYAVPETGGGYIRTGNYGRSTFVEREGLTYRLKNEAYRDGRVYGKYVGGDASGNGQVPRNQHWPVIAQVVERLVNSQLVKQLEQKVAELTRQNNL